MISWSVRDEAVRQVIWFPIRWESRKLDPIRYSLLFERFLNPERVSMPDIDVDFCYERRQEVIDYVVRKYGKDRVVQIVTLVPWLRRALSGMWGVLWICRMPCVTALQNDSERAWNHHQSRH